MYSEEVTIAKLGGTINLSSFSTNQEVNKLLVELDKQDLIRYSQSNSYYSTSSNSYHVNFRGESTFTMVVDDAPYVIDPYSVYMLDINCICNN